MVNLNRSLGMQIYKKICNTRRFVWSPFAAKIYIRDLQGPNYVVSKKGDNFFINNKQVNSDDDIIEKICKIIVDKDPFYGTV